MLELLRFAFALLVMVSHLSGFETAGQFGAYAVSGFFVISGYLITLVSRRTYGLSVGGTAGFLVNRALRIYPPYYAAVLLTLITIWIFGEQSIQLTEIRVPSSPFEIATNLFILPLAPSTSPRLVPPTWSVAVELVCYIVVFAVFSRSFWLALAGLISTAAYTGHLVLSGAAWFFRYFDVKPCLLPFAIGAVIYFLEEKGLLRRFGRRIFFMSAVAFGANMAFSMWYPFPVRMTAFFYLNLAVVVFLVIGALHAPIRDPAIKKWCKYLGKISYPLFLVQWACGVIVGQLIFHSSRPSMVLLLLTLPVALAVSAVLVECVDKPVERIRTSVKGRLKFRRLAAAAIQEGVNQDAPKKAAL